MPARINRPIKSEFVELRDKKSKKDLALHYGVSIATLHRWAVEFGVEEAKARIFTPSVTSFLEEEMDVIVGSLLGDGSLTKRQKPNHNSAFNELHGRDQLAYLEHKMERLARFNPYRTADGIGRSPSTGRPTQSVSFKTAANPLFTGLDKRWYKHTDGVYVLDHNGRRIKVVPPGTVLSARAVAYWFCDDGCNACENRQATFSTQGFTWEECDHLKGELIRLGITKTTVVRGNKKGQPIILIGSGSLIDFFDMIRPHVPKCMAYKVDVSKYTAPRLMYGETCPATKLSDEECRQAVVLHEAGVPHGEIAAQLGCSQSNISMIISGKTRKSLGVMAKPLSLEQQKQKCHRSQLTCELVDKIIDLNNEGKIGTEIAKITGVNKFTVWNVLDRTVWSDYTKNRTIIRRPSPITEEDVLTIVRLWNEGLTKADIGRQTGKNRATIQDILYRRTWKRLTADLEIRSVEAAPV